MAETTISHHTSTIPGPRDHTLFTQSWLPETGWEGARGCLILIHGLGEHTGRYQNLVQSILPLGFCLTGLDHLGHGRSEGIPGHIQQFSDLQNPVSSLIEGLRKEHEDLPLFLFGHSLGGLIAAHYTISEDPDLEGVVLSSPGVGIPESVNALTVFLTRTLSQHLPRLPLSSLDPEQISRDPEVVENYRQDPLVHHGRFSARMGAELLEAVQFVQRKTERFQLPLLTMLGTGDKLALPKNTRAFHQEVGSADKTLREYHGFYHELINEPGKARVLRDLHHWLEAHLPDS